MKVLMFDLEHGSKSIGSNDHIKSLFTYPVLSPGSWNQFQATLVSLYKEEEVTREVKVGNITIPETSKAIIPKNGCNNPACPVE